MFGLAELGTTESYISIQLMFGLAELGTTESYISYTADVWFSRVGDN
jgi:hypothetical protein